MLLVKARKVRALLVSRRREKIINSCDHCSVPMKPESFSWMSNWPHREIIYSALAAPAVPWGVILSTCLHFQTFHLSNCSLCSRSPVLSRHSLFFLWVSVPRGVSSALIWEWFHGTLLTRSVFIWLPPNHRPSLFLCLSYSWASVSLSLSALVIVPLKGPSFAQRLFDCPSQEDSSLSFIWLNYYAGFVDAEGMSDTSLNNQPPFLLRHLLNVCQLFLH